jgi:hypothetical protein
VAIAGALVLVRQKSHIAQGAYIPVVALAITGFLMFMTGISSAHFILALPFIILSVRWVRPATYFAIVGVWSLTTLITMWGILGIDLARADYLGMPLFGTGNGLRSLTRSIASVYAWDRFITVGAIANCLVVLIVGAAVIRSHFSKRLTLVGDSALRMEA